jgi:immune inhibitor A
VGNRVQPFDATFGSSATPALTLHSGGVPTKFRSQPGVKVFDDSKNTYWDPANPTNSVKVTDTNTKITVEGQPRDGKPLTVKVAPAHR